jgi:pimeloyl-ACP methyl ester carboxylesterase
MQIPSNGIHLEVEDHGSASGEPLLLIMGLGMQLVAWHEDFVQSLVARGFRVIRFDNRDIGLSKKLDHHGVPSLGWNSLKYMMRMKVASSYGLADMADDAAGVLDALGVSSAHVCGASMGGMIAQQLAVRHPTRVKSLSLMMTTSGARHLPGPTMKARAALMSRPAKGTGGASDFDHIVAHYVGLYKTIGSPAYASDDAWLTQRLSMSVRRSHHPQGTARQMMAIAADGDRSALLGRIKVPTQVLHGAADPLVPVQAGHDLARKIAGAEIDVIPGMGHDLPMALWPRFVAGISTAAGRA